MNPQEDGSIETMTRRSPRIAVVLWNGDMGGAETFSAMLCDGLRAAGADARILFVGEPRPLAQRLDDGGLPYETLGFGRGREVLRRPRTLARAAARLGADGALLVSPGLMAGALRLGGYRGRIVAVNHGIVQRRHLPPRTRVKNVVDRVAGFWACDVEVAVSDFVLGEIRRTLRPRRTIRIYNSVDTTAFRPGDGARDGGPYTVAWAGRLVAGKGVEDLLRAFASVRGRRAALLRIAGDGPLRAELERLATSLGVAEDVRFEGIVHRMASYWQACDVATLPSNEWVETFGMAPVEAMACGKPVVVTRNGALPEVVRDGETGRLIERGDVEALAEALDAYAADERLRREHGERARALVEARFDLKQCAASYLALFAPAAAAAEREASR